MLFLISFFFFCIFVDIICQLYFFVMERKYFILLLMLSFGALDVTSITSMDDGPEPLYIVPPPPINENGGPHRSPSSDNYVFQEGNVLSFSHSFAGCVFCLTDSDNEVVYTDSIDTNGFVELPSYLSGTYLLILYVGDDIYQGTLIL